MQRAHSCHRYSWGVWCGLLIASNACGGEGVHDYFPEDGTGGVTSTSAGAGGAASARTSAGVSGRTASGGASGQGTSTALTGSRTPAGSTPAVSGGGGATSTGTGGTGALGPPPWQSGSHAIAAFEDDTHCERVTFAKSFDAGDPVLAFATAVHPGSTWTHAPLARWVEGVSIEGFTACLREDSDYDGAHESVRLDWLALSATNASVMGIRAGRSRTLSTVGKTCEDVTFDPAFHAAPDVHVGVAFEAIDEDRQAAPAVWAEAVSEHGFRACAEPLQGSDGAVAPFSFAWFAVPASFASTRFVRGRTTLPAFSDVHCTTVETACADCDQVQLSVGHSGALDALDVLDVLSAQDPVLVWAEDFVDGRLTLCARETSGRDFSHGALELNWLLEKRKDG